jgi:hypothetical protein
MLESNIVSMFQATFCISGSHQQRWAVIAIHVRAVDLLLVSEFLACAFPTLVADCNQFTGPILHLRPESESRSVVESDAGC